MSLYSKKGSLSLPFSGPLNLGELLQFTFQFLSAQHLQISKLQYILSVTFSAGQSNCVDKCPKYLFFIVSQYEFKVTNKLKVMVEKQDLLFILKVPFLYCQLSSHNNVFRPSSLTPIFIFWNNNTSDVTRNASSTSDHWNLKGYSKLIIYADGDAPYFCPCNAMNN